MHFCSVRWCRRRGAVVDTGRRRSYTGVRLSVRVLVLQVMHPQQSGTRMARMLKKDTGVGGNTVISRRRCRAVPLLWKLNLGRNEHKK